MEMWSNAWFTTVGIEHSLFSARTGSNDGASRPDNCDQEQSSEDLIKQLGIKRWSNPWFQEWDDDCDQEQSSEDHYKDLINQLKMEREIYLDDPWFQEWDVDYNKAQSSEDHWFFKNLKNHLKMEREIYLDDPWFQEWDVVRVDVQPTRTSSYEFVRPDLGIKSMSSGMTKYGRGDQKEI